MQRTCAHHCLHESAWTPLHSRDVDGEHAGTWKKTSHASRMLRDRFEAGVKSLGMSWRFGVISSVGVLSMMACGSARPAPVTPTPPPPRPQIQLAVIPAESDAFPRLAQAV